MITMQVKHASALGNGHVILRCAISHHKWPRKVLPHKKRSIKVTTGERVWQVFSAPCARAKPSQTQQRAICTYCFLS